MLENNNLEIGSSCQNDYNVCIGIMVAMTEKIASQQLEVGNIHSAYSVAVGKILKYKHSHRVIHIGYTKCWYSTFQTNQDYSRL